MEQTTASKGKKTRYDTRTTAILTSGLGMHDVFGVSWIHGSQGPQLCGAATIGPGAFLALGTPEVVVVAAAKVHGTLPALEVSWLAHRGDHAREVGGGAIEGKLVIIGRGSRRLLAAAGWIAHGCMAAEAKQKEAKLSKHTVRANRSDREKVSFHTMAPCCCFRRSCFRRDSSVEERSCRDFPLIPLVLDLHT